MEKTKNDHIELMDEWNKMDRIVKLYEDKLKDCFKVKQKYGNNYNLLEDHKKKWDKYGITTNIYFDKFEGNTATKYRKTFELIGCDMKEVAYYKYINPFMKDLNALFRILRISTNWIADSKCIHY